MFTRQHYKVLAGVLHQAFRTCDGKEDDWRLIYNEVYTPLVKKLEADNERFDPARFSWAVATGEGL